MLKFDYIIVGGGSGGAVVASRLSEDPRISVLLIEAGGKGTSPFVLVPNAFYFIKGNPRYHWLMPMEPDPSRNGRRDIMASGKGLGGSSAINGMVFVKGLEEDYLPWRDAGGDDWSLQAIDRAFAQVENALEIRPPNPLHPTARAFIDSARALGFPDNSTDLLRTGVGVMPCPTSASRGLRQSTWVGYLKQARKRKNLTIVTESVVTRLIVEGETVCGVKYMKGGREFGVYANSEVILSAGAIRTPHILMLSGIGPAAHLREAGIQPVLDHPEIGTRLQEHPSMWIAANVSERSWNDDLKPLGMVKAGLQWLLSRSGPAASGMGQATLYGSTTGGSKPDYQLNFMPAGYIAKDGKIQFLDSSSISVAVSLCRSGAHGTVRLRSGNYADNPIIQYNLLQSPEDIRILADACRVVRNIFSSEPLGAKITGEAFPGKSVQTDDEWEQSLRANSGKMCHPCGTCRMGDDERSVVDPKLRLRGLKGLRIADASIMPTITSGNTNAPTIMIGERAAEFIRQDI
ncbi:GMC family oxidoreductase N-terminal domain-containing protein [Ensifer sp. ENS05]|uniref:GMC family oxidoreductase n=1 Tax=Ensifer sp. ENS05 TaxID=2769277 RepID=UPI0017808119|nr:GMC family oxidoreductase N-terminal domain-containing protein [Ensifer sp. ENS05]MBD9597358.1 GMC family oxidoreductase N-terminal domain-containing protein [Ensifer sp. ENS05]